VNPLAVRSHHYNHLGNEIHKLLELLFRTLALGDIDHGPHELTEIARAVEDRMALRPGSLVRLPSVDAGVSLMDRNAFDVVSGICGGHIDHVELRAVRRHLDV
jgi:hypothetical protein